MQSFNESLKRNLKIEYRRYNIDDIVYDAVVEFVANLKNKKIDSKSLSERDKKIKKAQKYDSIVLAKVCMELYIVNELKKGNDDIKNIVFFTNKGLCDSISYKARYKTDDVELHYEKAVEELSSKYDMNYNIRENLERITKISLSLSDAKCYAKAYSVRFLESYFELNKISIEEFAKQIGITKILAQRYVNSAHANDLPANLLPKLLEFANETNYYIFRYKAMKEIAISKGIYDDKEILKEVLVEIEKDIRISQRQELYADISFLEPYIQIKGDKNELATELGIAEETLNDYLKKNRFPIEKQSKLLLYYSECSLTKLQYRVEKEINEYNNKLNGTTNMMFLSNFLSPKKLSMLASILKITESKLDSYIISGDFPNKYIDKTLEFFNKNSIEDLKEFVMEQCIIKGKYVDLSFLKPYLELTDGYEELQKTLNINYTTLSSHLRKDKFLSSYVSKVLNLYQKNTIKELKNMVIDFLKNDCVDMFFLKSYLNATDGYDELANYLKIDSEVLRKQINKRHFLKENVNLLLKYYEKDDIRGLKIMVREFMLQKNKVEREQTIVKEELDSDICVDLSFLKTYLIFEDRFKELAAGIGIKESTLRIYLSKGFAVKQTHKVLKFYGKETIEELKQMVDEADKLRHYSSWKEFNLITSVLETLPEDISLNDAVIQIIEKDIGLEVISLKTVAKLFQTDSKEIFKIYRNYLKSLTVEEEKTKKLKNE